MASFTPIRGTRAEINDIAPYDGQFLFETDQGIAARIYADVKDNSVAGGVRRVIIGGDPGDTDFALSALRDVKLTNPAANNYLRFDTTVEGGKWVNDTTLSQKVRNLDENGNIISTSVWYDSTKAQTVKQKLDAKIEVSNPTANSYLFFNGTAWTVDSSLVNRVQYLDNNGKIGAVNVKYNDETTVYEEINKKISLPAGGNTDDALVKTVGGVAWKKVKVDVIDTLDSTSSTEPLSANQGRNLKAYIDALADAIPKKQDAPIDAGKAGQVLGLNESLQPIWKTVSGGGGVGGDWTDIENKPFNVVFSDDSLTPPTNPDFHIDKASQSGEIIKTLKLNDALIYRPTDTSILASNTDPEYFPCSVSVDGTQTKKKLSWTSLVERIKAAIFKQIVGTIDATDAKVVTFTNSTYIGGTDTYMLDVYCSEKDKFIVSQVVSGNTLTVTYNDTLDSSTVVVCIANKFTTT